MSIQEVIEQAQEYMQGNEVDGWLLYDYRGLNPIFADTVGSVGHVTRPVWLWIPASGDPQLLLSFVDQSRFDHLDLDTTLFINRRDMIEKLGEIVGLSSGHAVLESVPDSESEADRGDAIAELRRELGTRTPRVAMEYTPEGALPRSRKSTVCPVASSRPETMAPISRTLGRYPPANPSAMSRSLPA